MTPKSANQIVDMSFYGGAMHPGRQNDSEDESDVESQDSDQEDNRLSSSVFASSAQPTYSAPTNAPVAHHQPVAPAAPAPAATTPAAPEVATWLQCEIIECEKWRRIPSWVLADRLADLRKRTFYCYLNPDLERANCADAEESQDPSEFQV